MWHHEYSEEDDIEIPQNFVKILPGLYWQKKLYTNENCKYPKFVALGSKEGTAIQLRKIDKYTGYATYYRVAGEWTIQIRKKGLFRKLQAIHREPFPKDIDKLKVIPVSYEKWAESNAGYTGDKKYDE